METVEILSALRHCTSDLGCDTCPMRAGIEQRAFCVATLLKESKTAIIDLLAGIDAAKRRCAQAQAERDALREKQRWIPVTERLPEERALVNVVWVNRAPEPYYKKIKGVPFSGTACFYRGRWYWDSPVVLDLLAEYGEDEIDLVDEAVEVTHWLPLPEAPEEGEKA